MSQPLETLKDPRSFGAPPKHVKYYGGESFGSQSTSTSEVSNSISSSEASNQRHSLETEEEEDNTKPPPGPFRVDTTGLSTDNLPKPPLRKVVQGPPSPSNKPTISTQVPALPLPNKAKPSLPPRLPPRQSSPTASQPKGTVPKSPPPSYNSTFGSIGQPTSSGSFINQDAVHRLSKAGVTVPGLGIGTGSEHGNQDTSIATKPAPQSLSMSANMSELQSRFAKMSASSSSTDIPATPISPGKKPPLPPKKLGLSSTHNLGGRDDHQDNVLSPSKPPPVPLGTKPK